MLGCYLGLAYQVVNGRIPVPLSPVEQLWRPAWLPFLYALCPADKPRDVTEGNRWEAVDLSSLFCFVFKDLLKLGSLPFS